MVIFILSVIKMIILMNNKNKDEYPCTFIFIYLKDFRFKIIFKRIIFIIINFLIKILFRKKSRDRAPFSEKEVFYKPGLHGRDLSIRSVVHLQLLMCPSAVRIRRDLIIYLDQYTDSPYIRIPELRVFAFSTRRIFSKK